MASCPKCGHQNLPNVSTCYKCGTPLTAPAAPPAFTPPNVPAFRAPAAPAFTPPGAPAFRAPAAPAFTAPAAPPAGAPPAFVPPGAPPAFVPPGAPPAFVPPGAPPAFVPPAAAPAFVPPAAAQMPPAAPAFTAPPPGPVIESIEEYGRQMAVLAAKRKRNRMIIITAVAVGIVIAGVMVMQERKRKDVAGQKLAYAGRMFDMEQMETGAFWNCVMGGQKVDIGNFKDGEKIRQGVENAYFAQQKTFADYLTNECVPKMERARQAFGGMRDAPSELTTALEKYRETLPKLQAGIEDYAEKIRTRGTTKDTDQLIQEMGGAWHTYPDITAETAAYEKFLWCALPDLKKMEDAQELVTSLFNTCSNKDQAAVVAFMERIRTDCGPLLVVADKEAKVNPKSVPNWKTTHKKFLEEGEAGRELSAWEFCGKKSRKGKKRDEIEQFMYAVNDYMNARWGLKEAAEVIRKRAQ
jgi:hypothetical protein